MKETQVSVVDPKDKALVELEDSLKNEESVTDAMEKMYPDIVVAKIKLIAVSMAKAGMSFEESCEHANVDLIKMQTLVGYSDLLQTFFRNQELVYKRAKLKTISEKADKGDDRLALWLLTARYPDEFNPNRRKKEASDNEVDLVSRVLKFVQASGGTKEVARSEKKKVGVILSKKKGHAKNVVVQEHNQAQLDKPSNTGYKNITNAIVVEQQNG